MDLEDQLQRNLQKSESQERQLSHKDEEMNMLRLDVETLNEENRRLKGKLNEYTQKHEVFKCDCLYDA